MSYAGLTKLDGGDLLSEPSVLLVEDDTDVAMTLRRFMERSGIRCEWAPTGADALRLKESMRPDIVLVDLTLPDVDGGQLVSRFAAQQDCGVIVVSGRSDEVERIVGIEKGADDYVTKPVPLRELLARIRAVHRRAVRAQATLQAAPAAAPAAQVAPVAAASAQASGMVLVGDVRVDLRRRQVTGADNTVIRLTSAEYAALELLVEAAPQPVGREQICQHALRRPFHAEDRGVDQLILGLRRKLFADTAHSLIVSVRGQGYAITVERELAAGQAG